MKVAALTGFSGSGKTTLLTGLIARFVKEGLRVGAIKHTHHPLNEENRGDTARFRAAGADPVVLARDGEAVIFGADGTQRIRYGDVRELLELFSCEVVLVEGFAGVDGAWPKVRIEPASRPGVEELAAILDRIWRS